MSEELKQETENMLSEEVKETSADERSKAEEQAYAEEATPPAEPAMTEEQAPKEKTETTAADKTDATCTAGAEKTKTTADAEVAEATATSTEQTAPEQAVAEPAKEEKKHKKWIFIILGIVILILLILIYLMYNKMQDLEREANEVDAHGLVIDKEAGQYVAQDNDENLPGIAIPGWRKITIPPGQTEVSGSIDLYNPEQNEGWYYLTFQLLVETEDGCYEQIYESDLVEAGKHIQKITLTHPMEAGEYNAIMHVQPYLISDMAPMNNTNMELTLVVEE